MRCGSAASSIPRAWPARSIGARIQPKLRRECAGPRRGDLRREAIQRRGQPTDWTQFSPDDLWWTIPSSRVKGKDSKARPFMVPLTVDMLKILESLPMSKSDRDKIYFRNLEAMTGVKLVK